MASVPASMDSKIAQRLQDNYQVGKGNLVIRTPEGHKLYPPPYERTRIIERFHEDLLHPGIARTAAAVAESHYWPGLDKDVQRIC